jgi:hypothetical protein
LKAVMDAVARIPELEVKAAAAADTLEGSHHFRLLQIGASFSMTKRSSRSQSAGVPSTHRT